MKKITIGIVDDHRLFREGIVNMLQNWKEEFEVLLEATNGRELLNLLETVAPPQILIMDVSMPVLNGFETTQLVKLKFPEVKVLALTMLKDDHTFERLVRSGIDGYLNKDSSPSILKQALVAISETGYFFDPTRMREMLHILRKPAGETSGAASLSDRELEFVQLACSELTYKAISDQMCLSEKTVDGYRARVFDKLNVKSRVGLVMVAIKEGIVKV